MLDLVMNVILLFMLLSLFNLIRYMLKVRKIMKMHKDNPNIKGFTIVNGEVKPIEGKPGEFPTMPEMMAGVTGTDRAPEAEEVKKEVVIDPVCGQEVEKSEAYRILKEGQEYFFCSWECREKFLEGSNH